MESGEENRETGGQDSPSEEDCPQTEGGAKSCPEKSTLPLTADY
jgi:hypothetical protein